MTISMKGSRFLIAVALLALGAQRYAFGGSATWSSSPSTGNWNTASNWMPHTVPNGPADTATFGTSDVTDLSINSTSIEVSGILFNGGADRVTIYVGFRANLVFTDSGIVK